MKNMQIFQKFRNGWRDFKIISGISRPRGPRSERIDCDVRTLEIPDGHPTLNYDFYFRIFIDYIRHENELINHRTTWFIALQTIIGAAIGYIISKSGVLIAESILSDNLKFDMKISQYVVGWICLSSIGTVTSAAARNSIDAAIYSQDVTALIWERTVPIEIRRRFPDLMGGDSRQQAMEGSKFASHLPTFAWLVWCCLFISPPVLFGIKFIILQFIG